jgi:hypothetical protein
VCAGGPDGHAVCRRSGSNRQREDRLLRDVVFCMRGDLVRNLGNMCNPELHKGRVEVIDKVTVASTNTLALIRSNIFVC